MADQKTTDKTKVLITGFGAFNNHLVNPSWEIVRRLPADTSRDFDLIIPESSLESAYHTIISEVPKLIEKHDPDIIVHVGLDDGSDRGVFKVEKSSNKEGYHELPDRKKKVFTRAENKKVFGKAPERLETRLDLETCVDAWSEEVRGVTLPELASGDISGGAKGKGGKAAKGTQKGKQVEVVTSDDVGNYTCGFIYFVSLFEMKKRGRKGDVVFYHVPQLDGDAELDVGVKVTEALLSSLVAGWEGR